MRIRASDNSDARGATDTEEYQSSLLSLREASARLIRVPLPLSAFAGAPRITNQMPFTLAVITLFVVFIERFAVA